MWNKFIFWFIVFEIGCLTPKLRFTDQNYFWFEIEYQNIKRKNVIYYPTLYEKTNKNIINNKIHTFPLVISLHGGGGYFDSTLLLSKGRLLELKERYNFFLLLPEGHYKQWNDGRNFDSKINFLDDVGYIKALIKFTIENFPINRDKIFIFGISNGGMMSFRFACESAEWIEGFASIAATMPKYLQNRCKPYKKLNVLLIHGTKDPIVPYEGGAVKFFNKERGEVLSAEESIQFWLSKNQCLKIKKIKTIQKEKEIFTEIFDYECSEKKVKFFKIHNGGHTWPGGYKYLPEWWIGKTSNDFFAEEEIIEFFLKEEYK